MENKKIIARLKELTGKIWECRKHFGKPDYYYTDGSNAINTDVIDAYIDVLEWDNKLKEERKKFN